MTYDVEKEIMMAASRARQLAAHIAFSMSSVGSDDEIVDGRRGIVGESSRAWVIPIHLFGIRMPH